MERIYIVEDEPRLREELGKGREGREGKGREGKGLFGIMFQSHH